MISEQALYRATFAHVILCHSLGQSTDLVNGETVRVNRCDQYMAQAYGTKGKNNKLYTNLARNFIAIMIAISEVLNTDATVIAPVESK